MYMTGNDLIMPGHIRDYINLRKELKKRCMTQKELCESVARLIRLIQKTDHGAGVGKYTYLEDI